jgi:hypothetical protein
MIEIRTDRLDTGDVYEKTGKGIEEFETRKYKLPQKFRSLLILIDGKKTSGAIVSQFSSMGDAEESLAELERQGFIVRRSAASGPGKLPPDEEARRFQLAKTFMINTVSDAVGPMGSSHIEALKQCQSRKDLEDHLEAYFYLITSGRGKTTAEQYRKELLKLWESGKV